MKKFLKYSFIFLLLSGCIEPYEFKTKDVPDNGLVVAGSISNISANDYSKLPDNVRNFSVWLSKPGKVYNSRNEPVTGARVSVIDNEGGQYYFAELSEGEYVMPDPDFKALPGRQYKLRIELTNGALYESEAEELPYAEPVGSISFKEVDKDVYDLVNGKEQLRTIQGVDFYIDIPKNDTGEALYYKWDFVSTWIFEAPKLNRLNPLKTCWASSKSYISDYKLLKDLSGGYPQKLVFLQTNENGRLMHEFSLLVKQTALSQRYFQFWDELKEQGERGGLFDSPPYDVISNIKCVNCEEPAYGYFGVVNEQVKRIFITPKDLSYKLEVAPPYCGDRSPKPECSNCLEYTGGGTITNIKPSWWR